MRFVSQLLLVAAAGVAASGLLHAEPITALYYTSSATSWVGKGESSMVTPEMGFVFNPSANYDNGVSFYIDDFASSADLQSARWWHIDFAAPNNATLAVGTYSGATRFPFQSAANPGLDFSGNGAGNNTLSGEFTILEADYDSNGVRTFAADFVQYDEGVLANWVRGSIRLNSSIALPSGAMPDTIFVGDTDRIFTTPITFGPVTKLGTAVVTLTGENTYAGKTQVSAGVLQIGNGGTEGTLGLGVVSIGRSGTLAFNRSDNLSVVNEMSGDGLIVQKGAGRLTLSGLGSFTGALQVDSGHMVVRDASTSYYASYNFAAVIVNSGAVWEANYTQGHTLSAAFRGEGTVIKSGVGNLNLGAITAFTGDFDVQGGVLYVDAGQLGARSVRITGGAKCVLTLPYFYTYPQPGPASVIGTDISGDGDLEVSGSGSAELKSISGFTGKITLSGSAMVSADVSLCQATKAYIDNQSNLTLTGDAATRTLATQLTGSGRFTHAAAGTTTLTGAAGFSGTLAVTAGRVVIPAADFNMYAATSTGAGVLEVSGDYAGRRVPVVTGDGTVVFAGQGTLKVGNIAEIVTPQPVQTITLPSDFQTGMLEIETGVITGAGSLTKSGSGTLTLANFDQGASGRVVVNGGRLSTGGTVVSTGGIVFLPYPVATFTGTYRIESGRVVVNLSDVLAGHLVVNESATLELRTTDSSIGGLWSGVITGPGTVVVAGGDSTLTLPATARFSGSLQVADWQMLDLGTDSAATRVDGAVVVGEHAWLKGRGRIGGALTNAGTLAPGNSPGVIVVGGDFTNTGTLEIEVAGTGAAGATDGFDQVQYDGRANLGGVLKLTQLSGYTPAGVRSVRFLLDTSPGATPEVSGAFSSVILPAGLIGAVRASAGGVDLVYAKSADFIGHDGVAPMVAAAATSGGQVADSLIAAYEAGGASAAQRAAQNASPLGLGALTALPLSESRAKADAVVTRLADRAGGDEAYAGRETRWEAYAGVSGEYATEGDGASDATFDRNVSGGFGGLERRVGGNITVGAGLGYDSGRADFHNGGGNADQDHLAAVMYVSYGYGRGGFATVGVTGGASSYETKRNTVAGRCSGDTDGLDYGAFVGTGYRFRTGERWSVTPVASLQYARADVDGFTESGGAMAMKVQAYDQSSLRTRVGADVAGTVAALSDKLSIGFGAAWEHELLDDTVDIPAAFASAPATRFTTTSATLPVDVLSVGPRLAYAVGDAASVAFSYDWRYGFGAETSQRLNLSYSRRF